MNREQVIRDNMPLAHHEANRAWRPSIEREDMDSIAYEALVKAVDSWNPDKGTLPTHYGFVMRATLSSAIERGEGQSKIPSKMREAMRQYTKATGEDVSTVGDVTAAARIAGCTVETMQAAVHTVRQGYLPEGDEWAPRAPSAEEVALEHLEPHDPYAHLRDAVASLPPQQRDLIEKSYGLNGHRPRTDDELATELDITRWTVVRRKTKARNAIKATLTTATDPETRPVRARS